MDKRVEYNRRYYLKHLEQIKNKNKNKHHCEACKCDVQYSSLNHHQYTKKHNANVEKMNERLFREQNEQNEQKLVPQNLENFFK